MASNWTYAVEVIDANGGIASPALLEQRLLAVVEDVQSRLARGERAVPVGVLTTDDRDQWAKVSISIQFSLYISILIPLDQALSHLLSVPTNCHIYETIKYSLFALSLDDYSYQLPADHRTPDLDLTAHLHNIRSGHGHYPGHNRWYDKPYTLIVEANTRSGVLGEHSPVDALVPSVVADYSIVQGIVEDDFPCELDSNVWLDTISKPDVDGWTRLQWVVDDTIKMECEEAAKRAKAIVDDSDTDELIFDAYGVDWIKREGTPAMLFASCLRHRANAVLQRAYHPTALFKWRCSSRGIARAANSPRRTRLRSRASSTTAAPRRSARFRPTAARGCSRWSTRGPT